MLYLLYMGKVSPRKLSQRNQDALDNELLKALREILRKKDPELLLVLLTQTEQMMVARRIQVAKRLLAGWTIREIRRDLSVGQATVEAVEKWLRQQFTDYRDVLPSLYEELRKQAQERRRAQPVVQYTFRWLRRKYPLHFLLFNLLLDDLEFGRKKKKQPAKHRTVSYVAPSAAEARGAVS